jgi:hypothetical protein
MKKVFLTPEGWLVTDVREFRWYFDNPPPRPNAYLHQLGVDARSWKPIALWVVGIGFLAIAAFMRSWTLVPLALVVLGFWVWAFSKAVPNMRDSPLVVGMVGALDRHPILQDYLAGPATLEDGRRIAVAVSDTLIHEVRGGTGPIQILFVHTPTWSHCFAIGARALSEKIRT